MLFTQTVHNLNLLFKPGHHSFPTISPTIFQYSLFISCCFLVCVFSNIKQNGVFFLYSESEKSLFVFKHIRSCSFLQTHMSGQPPSHWLAWFSHSYLQKLTWEHPEAGEIILSACLSFLCESVLSMYHTPLARTEDIIFLMDHSTQKLLKNIY